MTKRPCSPIGFVMHHLGCWCASRPTASGVGRLIAAGIIALAVAMTTADSARASDQTLEIPQVVDTSTFPGGPTGYDPFRARRTSYPNTAAEESAAAPSTDALARNAEYPSDPNLGSINDYENQAESDRRPAPIAIGRGSARADHGSATANLIVGGIIIGLVALEIASAHRHHR